MGSKPVLIVGGIVLVIVIILVAYYFLTRKKLTERQVSVINKYSSGFTSTAALGKGGIIRLMIDDGSIRSEDGNSIIMDKVKFNTPIDDDYISISMSNFDITSVDGDTINMSLSGKYTMDMIINPDETLDLKVYKGGQVVAHNKINSFYN